MSPYYVDWRQDKYSKLKAKHSALLAAAKKARDLLEGDVVTVGTSSLRKPVVAAHAVLVAACEEGGE